MSATKPLLNEGPTRPEDRRRHLPSQQTSTTNHERGQSETSTITTTYQPPITKGNIQTCSSITSTHINQQQGKRTGRDISSHNVSSYQQSIRGEKTPKTSAVATLPLINLARRQRPVCRASNGSVCLTGKQARDTHSHTRWSGRAGSGSAP